MDKSTNKRSFYGRKLQSQQRIADQPTSSLPSTPMTGYLTTESIRTKSPRSSSSTNCGTMQIEQVEEDREIFIFLNGSL